MEQPLGSSSYLTLGGTNVVVPSDLPVAPLTSPIGQLPTASALSVGAAAIAAADGASVPSPEVGTADAAADHVKNIIFVLALGFVLWKYGRRFI